MFHLGFSTLLAHELDAMTQAEWRLLFILRQFPDLLARNLFVTLHVPVVAILLWLIQHPSTVVRRWARTSLALFMVIHAGLHWNLRNHPLSTFTSTLSLSLIYGAGLLGFIYVVSAKRPKGLWQAV
ncbi:hypothetical protein S7335_5424 [Synechococcus sp. PCC 7335]|nr:hypothetical protein S7335_5424 [Synechococcus sp. PCC 7335]